MPAATSSRRHCPRLLRPSFPERFSLETEERVWGSACLRVTVLAEYDIRPYLLTAVSQPGKLRRVPPTKKDPREHQVPHPSCMPSLALAGMAPLSFPVWVLRNALGRSEWTLHPPWWYSLLGSTVDSVFVGVSTTQQRRGRFLDKILFV